MKQILFYILFSLFTCLTICAEPYTPESLPNVFDRTTRVANPDGLLSQAAVDSINSMLLSLDSHEVQCIVVVVNNIKGDDPYEFAMGLGRRFGVGGEKNLGIVLVLATDDRSYEMITGDGMEKFLPDIICHRIQEHTMVPLLKKSDWDGAMVATVRAIKGYLEEDPEIMDLYHSDDEDDSGLVWVFLGLVGFLFGSAWRSARKAKKCPRCGKHKLKKIRTETQKLPSGITRYTYTLRCTNCGHELTRNQDIDLRNNGSGGRRTGMFIGGAGLGMGRSSGGFGGGGFGSLGGGHFGGGGSGGRF